MISYGVTKAEEGVYSATDGSVTGWVEIDLYKNTFALSEEDPTRTPHYKQGQASPSLVVEIAGANTVNFSLMDLSASSKRDWVGGTITTLNNKNTWHAPRIKTSKIKALRFTLEDGSVMTMPKVSCWTKAEVKASDSEINLMPVVGTILDPGFADVLPVDWVDA